MSWLFGLRRDPGGPGPEAPPPPGGGQGGAAGAGGNNPDDKDQRGRMDAYRFVLIFFKISLGVH